MDKELRFEGCKLTCQLISQSPHIHFQHEQDGATLRGSELKPKLDHFLCRKMGSKENDALNYKVQLTCERKDWRSVELDGKTSYPIFYGNTRKDGITLKGIWSKPNLTIICFDTQLKQAIERHILEFFYVTNFGMMQGKGFGSYIPDVPAVDKATIKKWLVEEHEVKSCWSMSYKKKDVSDDQRGNAQFQMIKSFYGIMKSGRNFGWYARSFLFEYMHKNCSNYGSNENIVEEIGNEKAWMKGNKIAPIASKSWNKKNHDLKVDNPRYVRALLGLSSTQSWLNEDLNYRNKVNISIKDLSGDSDKKIERINSPVFFKIVGRDIFFVIRNIHEMVYDHEFRFEGLEGAIGSGLLSTPSKEQFLNKKFDVDAFMTAYVKYFEKLRGETYYNNNKNVSKIENEKDFTTIEK